MRGFKSAVIMELPHWPGLLLAVASGCYSSQREKPGGAKEGFRRCSYMSVVFVGIWPIGPEHACPADAVHSELPIAANVKLLFDNRCAN